MHRSIPARRELLLAYPWPGNVRELSHVIERAVLWSRGRRSTRSTCRSRRPSGADRPQAAEPRRRGIPAPAAVPGASPRRFRRRGWIWSGGSAPIEQALRDCGEPDRAAQRLGSAEYAAVLKKFGIQLAFDCRRVHPTGTPPPPRVRATSTAIGALRFTGRLCGARRGSSRFGHRPCVRACGHAPKFGWVGTPNVHSSSGPALAIGLRILVDRLRSPHIPNHTSCP